MTFLTLRDCVWLQGVVGNYGATYSIAGHISEAVPLLREHYDKSS